MPKIGTLDFTGISGHKYTFNVYPKNREQKEKEAVYVVTHRTIKAVASVDHDVIYIGETSDLKNSYLSRQQLQERMVTPVITQEQLIMQGKSK